MYRSILVRRTAMVLSVALAAALIPIAPRAGEADLHTDQDSPAKALKKGKATVDLRYRWEQVTDDFPPSVDPANHDEGYASTLRTTLGYQTARWVGFNAYLQFEDVSDLGAGDKHDSTSNGVQDRPVIADPNGTEVQQAYLRYTLPDVVQATAGRLEFNYDDQRFIGAVAWRQNHQSFDLIKGDVLNIPRTRLSLAYLGRVHRIFGDSKDMDSILVNANIGLVGGNLTPYVYVLDFDRNSGLLAQSSTTYGASWDAAPKVGDRWTIPYHLQYARQSDSGDNPNERDADYVRLEVGGKHERGFWFKVGYELLGGSPDDGQFTTPLATLHKFNGWADRFLATPAGGLEDVFVAGGLGWAERWSAMAAYHVFGADTSFVDLDANTVDSYGTELDASLTYKASWKQTFSLKMALYSADDASALATGQDVTKLWFYTTYKF